MPIIIVDRESRFAYINVSEINWPLVLPAPALVLSPEGQVSSEGWVGLEG